MSRAAALSAVCSQLWAIAMMFAASPAASAVCASMVGVWTALLLRERLRATPEIHPEA